MVFFAVKIFFFRFEAKRKFVFATSCHDIIFFLQKQYFLRPKEQTEYVFLLMSIFTIMSSFTKGLYIYPTYVWALIVPIHVYRKNMLQRLF